MPKGNISLVVFICCSVLSVTGIILAVIALQKTNDLEDESQSKEPFENWITVNATLYKNSVFDNITLLEFVPIIYTRIEKQVLIRLPALFIEDTFTGPLSFLTLLVKNEDRLPFIVGDSHPWGTNPTVSLTSSAFRINLNNTESIIGEITASELGATGQVIEYDFTIGHLPVPSNSNIDINGGLYQYETSIGTSISMVLKKNFVNIKNKN